MGVNFAFLVVSRHYKKGSVELKIFDILERMKNSGSVAVIDADKEYSYKEIYELVISNALEIHTDNCNNVGIFIENSIDYMIAYFVITYKNKTIVPIESTAKSLQILSTINYCELKHIITNNNNIDNLLNMIRDKTQTDVAVYNIDTHEMVLVKGTTDKKFDFEADLNENDDNSVAIMLHTSGTTSDPKKVMLTHRNLIENVRSNIESLQLDNNDRCLIVLPMCFGYCNTSQMLTHLYLGGSIVIYKGTFFPKRFYEYITRYGCTNTTCIPSMLYLMVKSKSPENVETLRYLCFGGGTIADSTVKRLIEILPCTGIVQTYGQTEASPRVTALLPQDAIRKLGSVGMAIPGIKVIVVDDNNNEVPVGTPGEIIVNGPNVMKGYYKRDEETQKAVVNGWLHTGDIGYYDSDGYLYIIGRLKNMLISGGRNIYPEEIEELLRSHPTVKEAVIYPIQHEVLGEVPGAKIVIDNENNIGISELMDYCRENLEAFKIPVKIEIVDQIEKTYNGKVKRIFR